MNVCSWVASSVDFFAEVTYETEELSRKFTNLRENGNLKLFGESYVISKLCDLNSPLPQ